MPTSRTLPFWLAGLVLSAVLAVASGCAGPTDGSSGIGSGEDAIGERPKAAGIAEGSPEEEGVLLLVNDRAATPSVLESRAQLASNVAEIITGYRIDAAGKPRWFASVDEIDALPGVDGSTFVQLVADAKNSGYTETPGFDPPTLAKISVLSGLGRPPTSADVTVEAGFDGKPAIDACALVRARITNTVDASNDRFVLRTIAAEHKAFTLAIGNFFAQGSPHATYVKSLGADSVTLLGTMSSVRPNILVAVKAGVTTYHARGDAGTYEPIDTPPHYPVIMRARIRLETGAADDPGQGVRVFYPAWSSKALSGPTSSVTEGGSG